MGGLNKLKKVTDDLLANKGIELLVKSIPPEGYLKVVNIYYDPEGKKLISEVEKDGKEL